MGATKGSAQWICATCARQSPDVSVNTLQHDNRFDLSISAPVFCESNHFRRKKRNGTGL